MDLRRDGLSPAPIPRRCRALAQVIDAYECNAERWPYLQQMAGFAPTVTISCGTAARLAIPDAPWTCLHGPALTTICPVRGVVRLLLRLAAAHPAGPLLGDFPADG